MHKNEFGEDFIFGVATASFQIEGAHNLDGKGKSIWDTFISNNKRIFQQQNAHIACDHYHRYVEDITLIRHLNIPNYRLSLSWARILPEGVGRINQQGVNFYDRLIDTCLENNITPWITLYHWDLPQALQEKGGWTNREILNWFGEYVDVCSKKFGDRVKNWMILNEPLVFTGAGYYLGLHAPGIKGINNFLPAVHHAALCQSKGARIIRGNVKDSNIGTTFSYTHLEPYRAANEKDIAAVKRLDALANRLFLEPLLGMGYPVNELPLLKKLDKFVKGNDLQDLPFDMDFIGTQIYTRELVKHSSFIPYIQARIIPANKRFVYHSTMNWEIYPECIFQSLMRLNAYENIPKIIITENGVAVEDKNDNGKIIDHLRIAYIQQHLRRILKAKHAGANVHGYFVWSLIDNFEWAEGYKPRFGLIYIDYKTQKRIIKESGYWYRDFLS